MDPYMIALVGLLVNALTCLAVVIYTRAAIATAQAAFAQAEAARTPCVVPGMTGETMSLHNVGNGPALHVEATLTPLTEKPTVRAIAGAIPTGEPDRLGPFPDGGTKVEIRYQSMSGIRYRTSIDVIGPDAPGAKWKFTFEQVDAPTSPLIDTYVKNLSKKKPPRGNLKVLLGLAAFAIAASTVTCSGDVRGPKYEAEREAFKQSVVLLRESSDLSQPPAGETSFGMTPEQEQKFHDLIDRGLAESDKVSDSFLDSLHPELRAMYRDGLIAGTRLYIAGVKAGNTQEQSDGIQKQIQWIAFWEKHNAELVDKMFEHRSYGAVNFLKFNGWLLLASFLATIVFGLGLWAFLGPAVLLNKDQTQPKMLVRLLFALSAVFQIYFWGLWSAFCVAFTIRFTQKPEVTWLWIYWLTSFSWCIGLMGFFAQGESVLPPEDTKKTGLGIAAYSVVIVGAFLVFAFFQKPMMSLYGWFLTLIGLA